MILYNVIAIVVCYLILKKTMNPLLPSAAYFLYKGIAAYFLLFNDPSMGMMVPFAIFFLLMSTVLIYGISLLILKKKGNIKYILASLLCVPILLF
ncbi:MAG: hypothetical protein OFPI_19950 [Osedax symbiont Rs2]|nr:MAG: hypothetical protein OFPI_19950 [Osedax symbiont Rs2]